MRQIVISTEKIGGRAARIEALDFGDSDGERSKREFPTIVPAPATLKLEAGE
jgi:hypothetical protein